MAGRIPARVEAAARGQPAIPKPKRHVIPVLDLFHPAIQAWFASAFAAPTAAQVEAWPAIKAGRHALVAAPTGSGKTLAAFLAAIDSLVHEAIAAGARLPDETRMVYVSPLKALSNDIQRNLEVPLEGIRAELERLRLPDAGIRSAVRTGDTPQSERAEMRRRPPHIIVTTPESLYIGDVLVEFADDLLVQPDDALFVCGSINTGALPTGVPGHNGAASTRHNKTA